MTRKVAHVCEDLKREIKLEMKEFRESWDRDLRKELRVVGNFMNFISNG